VGEECPEPESRSTPPNQRRWRGVLPWFSSPINNGILMGISSMVQAATACARGYRSARNLITIIYLLGGKAEIRLAHLTYQ